MKTTKTTLKIPSLTSNASPHLHDYQTIHKNIQAEYTKGKREKFFAKGNYQQCSYCFKGRFIPYNRILNVVYCEISGEL